MFNAGKRLDQGGAHDFQLAAVMGRQLVEQPRALGGDAQQDAASVVLVGGALQQTFSTERFASSTTLLCRRPRRSAA